MKKVLFIAYYFPPMGGSGVQRSIKFVKYLAEFGWQPVVLTVNDKFTCWSKDKSLLKEIPADVQVYRTPTLDLNWLYKVMWGLRLHKLVEWLQLHWLIPDSEITWLPFAKKCIAKIVREQKIDLVYITGGPFSSMLLGPYVSNKYKLRYVVDFRDEWTNNPSRLQTPLPVRSQQKELTMEKQVLNRCAAIIYALPHYMKTHFEQKYCFLKDSLHREIFNGYDEKDFLNINMQERYEREHLQITYIGQFYDSINPAIIWQALSELDSEKSINADKLRIDIIGRNSEGFVLGRFANSNTIKKIVRFKPNMPHHLALKEMNRADALLLFVIGGPNCNAVTPGKIYEYLRSYKPILAIIPSKGVSAEILTGSRTGFIYDSSDLLAVKTGFLHIYNLWERGELIVTPDKTYIGEFERKRQTHKLAGLFDEVLTTVQSKV